MGKKLLLGLLFLVLLFVLVWRFFPHLLSNGESSNAIQPGANTVRPETGNKEPVYLGAPAISIRPNGDIGLNLDPNISNTLLPLLKKKDFQELDRIFESYGAAFEAGEINEFSLHYLFTTMTQIDSELLTPMLQWAKQSKSWGAYMAAHYFTEQWAWQWRGGAFYRYVPESNKKEYQRFSNLSASLLESAKRSGQRNFLWHARRILMAKQGHGDLAEVSKRALTEFPKSERVLLALIDSQNENWGGNEFTRQDYIHQYRTILDQGQHETGPTSYYYEAIDAADEKRFASAITALEKAVELNPNRVIYYFQLMNYYAKVERFGAAIEMADLVLKHWPKSAITLMRKAEILAKIERYDEAEKVITTLLKQGPLMRKANKTAVEVYAKTGDRDGVKLALERGSYFTQNDPAQWVKLAYHVNWDLKDPQWALTLYQKAYDLQKLNVGANYAMATIYGDRSDCQLVPHLYNYFLGCEAGESKTEHWCATRYKNWAYSSVNYLQGHQQCPEVNDYDFERF